MKTHRNNVRPIVGILLVAFGLIWAVNTIWPGLINILFDGWWTLFIIVPCLCALFTDRDKTGPSIGLAIGVLLLLSQQDIIDLQMLTHLFLAILIVILGLRLLLGGRGRKGGDAEYVEAQEVRAEDAGAASGAADGASATTSDGASCGSTAGAAESCGNRVLRHYDVSFGERRERVDAEPFYGADIDVSFGAFRLDLTDAIIHSDVVLSLDCSFCGVTIFVPSRYAVQISSKSAFGGVVDKRATVSEHPEHIIRIVGQTSFAGVEVR